MARTLLTLRVMFSKILGLALISGLTAFANPIITGIYEAQPNDPATDTTLFDYRAIEFFTEDVITEQEFSKYFLRADYESFVPPFGAAPVQLDMPFLEQGGAPTDAAVAANTFFYAVPLTATAGPAPFFAFYTAAWAGNPRISEPPVLAVVDPTNAGIAHEGDTKYTLMYDPNGDNDYTDAIAMDAFGEQTPFGNPTLYDNTFAYRKNNTGPDGDYDPNNWVIGAEGALGFNSGPAGSTAAQAAVIPFGTFTIPEPGTSSLVLFGALVMLSLKRRRA
jgi:hypothetical protein